MRSCPLRYEQVRSLVAEIAGDQEAGQSGCAANASEREASPVAKARCAATV